MALWHLNMILVFGQLMGFLGLKYKFRSAGVADEKNDYSYKELQQMDEIDLSTSDDEGWISFEIYQSIFWKMYTIRLIHLNRL